MPTISLSSQALSIIQEFLHLPIKNHDINCPYLVNRRQRVRGALRALIGKGSPDDIVEECMIIALKEKRDIHSLTNEELKKFLVDHHIGVDCSALAYYVLDAEQKARGAGTISSRLFFPRAKNIFRKLIVKLRPVENTDVRTLAHEKNSVSVSLADTKPGDMIFFLEAGPQHDRDHVLIIHSIDTEQNQLRTLHYTHSFQWSIDGKYGHGVRQGVIHATDLDKPLINQEWIESGKSNSQNETLRHAKEATHVLIKRLMIT